MRYALIACAAVLLSGVAYAASTTEPSAASVPEPEQFLADGHYSDYEKAALQFLIDHPDAAAAPRVTMDLLITATVFDDQTSALRMRMLLVAQYPTSAQAKYMIGSLPDAQQFAQLMALVAAANLESIPPGFPVKFDQAQRLGVARFGAAALGSGPQLVEGLLLAQMSGDSQIANAEVQLLNSSGPAGEIWRQILSITADNSATPLERMQRLHALTNRTAATPFEQYMFTQLPAAQRDSADVTRIEADDLLDAGRMADALPKLTKLAAGDAKGDARILFWKAWATAAEGDPSTGDTLMAQVAHDHASDAWGKEAAELEPALKDMDASLLANVEAALSASRRLKGGVGSLEGHATYTRADGQHVGIYLGIDAPNLMELSLDQAGKPALVYRASEQSASIFLQGAPQKVDFTKPILFPAPKLSVTRVGENFRFAGDVGFVASFAELQTALADLMSSDLASTREGLEDVMHDFAHKGILPLPPQSAADGSTTYSWVNPAVAQPTQNRVSFTVASDGTITALQAGGFQITDLHYGPAGSVKVTPPAMPAGTSVDRGSMNTAVLQAILPAISQILNPPPPAPAATQPAAK